MSFRSLSCCAALPLSLLTLTLFSMTARGQDGEPAIAEAVVEAVPGQDADLATATPDRKLRPLTVTISLTDDTQLTGTLIESTEISIKTAFGEAAIPLSEVAGIRFPAAEDSSTTVVMLNGDSITGATDVKFFGIETAWGSAKVNGQNIGTLLFVPGLQWTSNVTIGGKRWTLVEASAAPGQLPINPAAQSNAGQNPASAAPVNRFPSTNPAPRVIFGQ